MATFDTVYTFKAGIETQQARVSVYAPLGLQSIDEYVLWGLLGIDPTLDSGDRCRNA